MEWTTIFMTLSKTDNGYKLSLILALHYSMLNSYFKVKHCWY